MNNNIKKASVKFREDLLYFQRFMLIFVLPQISDYHHLNRSGGPSLPRSTKFTFFSPMTTNAILESTEGDTKVYGRTGYRTRDN